MHCHYIYCAKLMIAWCNIAISSLAVTHCKSTSLVCVDLPLAEVSCSPCPLQSFAGSVSLPICLPLFKVPSLSLSFSQASLFPSFIHRIVFLIAPSVSPIRRLLVLAKPGLYIFVSVHSEYNSWRFSSLAIEVAIVMGCSSESTK